MTAEQFRRLALHFPETSELAHMGHADFRVGGKIFATLGHPGAGWAMIKLPPGDQRFLVKAQPQAFSPVLGGWGEAGATRVQLCAARAAPVREALTIAWRARAPKRIALLLERD